MSKGAKRVLVVEDDPDINTLTCRVLEGKGFATLAAPTGADALALIQSQAPDLILLDIDMPGMDGWGFLEKLGPPPRPPVIFVSGQLDFDAFSKGARAGIAGFAAKPIRYGELLATCRRILEPPPPVPPSTENRRVARRQQMLVRVDVVAKAGATRMLGELRDLSLTGAQVITVTPLESGARVRFLLDAGVTGVPMRFDSEVRWCKPLPDGFAHGVELVDVTPEQAECLRQVVG